MSASDTSESNISAEMVAAAVQRRLQQQNPPNHETQRIQEYEKRQNFRRLINPGILQPNAKGTALSSLKTLLTISQNLLREPENPKFQQFKPTNNTIKRTLIDPKGTLEYAIALGFRPKVLEWQQYYIFDSRKTEDLRIGAAILQEALDLEVEKQERTERAKREEKAAKEAVVGNVKLAFLDDRKSRELHDQRERELREARQAAAQNAQNTAPSSPMAEMPGAGITIVSSPVNHRHPSHESEGEDD